MATNVVFRFVGVSYATPRGRRIPRSDGIFFDRHINRCTRLSAPHNQFFRTCHSVRYPLLCFRQKGKRKQEHEARQPSDTLFCRRNRFNRLRSEHVDLL